MTGWDGPIADADTYHKCRNFDAILDWVTKNRVRVPQDHMVRTGNEVDLPEWHPPD
jgi:Mycotoxin biosynthesis protein UstYa